jgi:hypothetical protein
MKIEDDFLDQEQFDTIIKRMEEYSFPWSYNDNIDNESDVDKFQFAHMFYLENRPGSNAIQIVSPILAILKPISILRIKANLLTRTPNIIENEFHVDMSVMTEEKQKQWTTSIFYVNTNNGYTKFEDGTKVESVANRMITFPSTMKHTGTSCTDEKKRIVINFNYYI